MEEVEGDCGRISRLIIHYYLTCWRSASQVSVGRGRQSSQSEERSSNPNNKKKKKTLQCKWWDLLKPYEPCPIAHTWKCYTGGAEIQIPSLHTPQLHKLMGPHPGLLDQLWLQQRGIFTSMTRSNKAEAAKKKKKARVFGHIAEYMSAHWSAD